jgi:error-prone DNA polymerase
LPPLQSSREKSEPTHVGCYDMTDYVELHCRSAFSFLRAASTPEQLAERTAELQMPAVALCDRDGLYGAPRFFSKAKEAGIRPIVGAELTLDGGIVLPLLVQSRRGYENLCQLLTRAHLRNEKGRCSVHWNELPEFTDGLVALANETAAAVYDRRNRPFEKSGAHRAPLHILIDVFGRKNVFIEIQRHRLRGEENTVRSLVNLAQQFQLPLLATNGVLYSTENERPVLDVFTCIRNRTHLDAAGKLLERNGERYLKSAAQMCELFCDLPEAIANTVRLAERLSFTLENLGYEFPSFSTPPKHTADSFFANRHLSAQKIVTAGKFLKKSAYNWKTNWRSSPNSRSPDIFSSFGTSENFAASKTSWRKDAAAQPTARFVFASASRRLTR